EDDRVELVRLETGPLQAPFDRGEWERRVVLSPRETLFLDCANRETVDQKRRGRVVVVSGNAENAHQYCPSSAMAARDGEKPSGSRRAARLASKAKNGRITKYWIASMTVPSKPARAVATRR